MSRLYRPAVKLAYRPGKIRQLAAKYARCPVCCAPPGEPCQKNPHGPHLAALRLKPHARRPLAFHVPEEQRPVLAGAALYNAARRFAIQLPAEDEPLRPSHLQSAFRIRYSAAAALIDQLIRDRIIPA